MPHPSLPPADVIALSFVHGLPPDILFPLLRGETPAESPLLPFDAACEGPRPTTRSADACPDLESLLRVIGCEEEGEDGLARAARSDAQQALATASSRGMEAITWGEARYPPLLAEIFDPPLVLWVRGNIEILSGFVVAIVGSRAASPYGEQAAARLAAELASRGVIVASGMARGIDASAHRGALTGGGRTIAVLGCGADVAYPPEHAALRNEMLLHGSIVSEYPPGAPPAKWNFPRRNRIISGLSRGVVVVEASQHSGALITASCALEQGREVMAVPGNVLGERHRGSHGLLKCGAALVESASDVLDALRQNGVSFAPVEAAVGADPLLAAMDEGECVDLDGLARATGFKVVELLPRLLEMELQGRVRRVSGGRFVRPGERANVGG